MGFTTQSLKSVPQGIYYRIWKVSAPGDLLQNLKSQCPRGFTTESEKSVPQGVYYRIWKVSAPGDLLQNLKSQCPRGFTTQSLKSVPQGIYYRIWKVSALGELLHKGNKESTFQNVCLGELFLFFFPRRVADNARSAGPLVPNKKIWKVSALVYLLDKYTLHLLDKY